MRLDAEEPKTRRTCPTAEGTEECATQRMTLSVRLSSRLSVAGCRRASVSQETGLYRTCTQGCLPRHLEVFPARQRDTPDTQATCRQSSAPRFFAARLSTVPARIGHITLCSAGRRASLTFRLYTWPRQSRVWSPGKASSTRRISASSASGKHGLIRTDTQPERRARFTSSGIAHAVTAMMGMDFVASSPLKRSQRFTSAPSESLRGIWGRSVEIVQRDGWSSSAPSMKGKIQTGESIGQSAEGRCQRRAKI